MVIHTVREFAGKAIKTHGRTMVIMGGGINHWYHADVIYFTILNLLMMYKIVTAATGRITSGRKNFVRLKIERKL